jgi:hypothetical protein
MTLRDRRRGCRAGVALLLLVLIGCGADNGLPPAPADDSPVFEDERSFDLTGNGLPERITVVAAGPSYDSLRIRLAISTAEDTTLYVDGWDSSYYYEHVVQRPPATQLQSEVRGHLTELLRDAAFKPPAIVDGTRNPAGVMPDLEALRWDIAERSWRRSAGLPDTVPLHAQAWDEINQLVVPEADLEQLAAELAKQPSFTYYAGGEVVHTIAWSERERRFIRIRSCC